MCKNYWEIFSNTGLKQHYIFMSSNFPAGPICWKLKEENSPLPPGLLYTAWEQTPLLQIENRDIRESIFQGLGFSGH